jgi:hypothetical protein
MRRLGRRTELIALDATPDGPLMAPTGADTTIGSPILAAAIEPDPVAVPPLAAMVAVPTGGPSVAPAALVGDLAVVEDVAFVESGDPC